MKLIYNSTDLVALATHVRLLQTSTIREPAEAPQRERVTMRVRLEFLEDSFRANYALIQQARAALKTQQAVLLFQEDEGEPYMQRTVTAAEDEAPEERPGSTYRQSLTIVFWYFNHDLTTNCLNAAVTTADGASDLGAVERWEERLSVSRFDELRDPRQRVAGQVTAVGRWQADTTQSLDERRQALIAQKTALKAAIVKGATITLAFADFTQTVRVVDFKVDLDQPNNYVGWQLSVTYTCYPDERDYLLCELRVTQRENKAEGVALLHLNGRIGAASEAAARSKLATLKGALVPSGYLLQGEESEARTVESVSGAGGDGAAFIELTYSLEYRETATLACTFKRDKINAATVDLGTVDRFTDRYATTLFDELRSLPKRTAGAVTINGMWTAPESATDKATVLLAKKAALDAELSKGISGTVQYGTVFNKLVRVMDFYSEINRLKNRIEWSLSANFTRFPNEADYALCEFRLTTREDKEAGTVHLAMSGKIGAPTPELARAKLARLRTQLVPAGYVRMREDSDENRVDVESGMSTGPNTGGATFIESTFSEDYQKTAADVPTWTLRVASDDDVKTAMVHTTYAGQVTATGAMITDAFNTASAQAAALGDGKYDFKTRSQVTENERLFQTTGGKVFVTVDFSY